MKKTALGLFLISSIVMGISTLSSADVNNEDFLSSWLKEYTNGDVTLKWSSPYYSYSPSSTPESFKVYISPALSSEDFWGNKSFKYTEVGTVDKALPSEDENSCAYYEYDFEDLDKNSFYRFKIDAYCGKELLCTHYCTNVYDRSDDFYPEMKISGSKGTISWYNNIFDDATVKIYRSGALKSKKFGFQDVSYTEIGEAAYESGEFTVKDLKKGETHYYGFVIYENGTPVCRIYKEFGTILEAPETTYPDNEYSHADKNYIQVPFRAADEDTPAKDVPDGLIIYRKNKKGKFVEIGRVKPLKKYIDKNVKPGKSYTYKARTYKKIKGKTYYSCYSDEVTIAAVNKEGKARFRISFDKKDSTIVKLESLDKYNGTIRFLDDSFDKGYSESNKIVKYSLDGKKWKKNDGSGLPALKPGKTIFFKLSDKPSRNGINMRIYYGEGLRDEIYFNLYYCDKTKTTTVSFQYLD